MPRKYWIDYKNSNNGVITQALWVHNIQLGDLSQDGIINISDIVLLVEAVLAISEGGETSDEALLYGDIYPDGQLNIIDIVALVNIILDN